MSYQLDKFQYGLEKLNIDLSQDKLNKFIIFYYKISLTFFPLFLATASTVCIFLRASIVA